VSKRTIPTFLYTMPATDSDEKSKTEKEIFELLYRYYL
jgi:hypothetical protein